MAPLFLQTLGPVCLRGPKGDIPIRSAPARLLLGLLALDKTRAHSRSRLAALLSEDADEPTARSRLRHTVHRLRAELGDYRDVLVAQRDSLALDAGHVETDTDHLISALDRGDVPEDLAAGKARPDTLLAGFDASGALLQSARLLQIRVVETKLRTGLSDLCDGPDPGRAIRAASALLHLDASDEKAARFLITAHAEAGDIGKALSVYRALWDTLDAEFDMEPSEQTQALIADVKSGVFDRPSKPALQLRPAMSRANSLAILPIQLAGDSGKTAALAQIFRVELISRLSRFREFEVIDSQQKADAGEFALEIAVLHSDHFHLVVTLSQTADGRILWSDRFTRIADALFAHLQRVAGAVAAACSLNLSRAQLARVGGGSALPSALDAWIQSQDLIRQFRPKAWARADRLLGQAIADDANFSMAHSARAQLRHIRHLIHPGESLDINGLRDGRRLANRAIELDPWDSRGHLARGWSSMLMRDYAHARAAFVTALEINPDDPWTVISSALAAAFDDDRPLAEELADRGLREGWTTTATTWSYLATIRFLQNDPEGCIAAAENAETGIANIAAWKAAAHWRLGQFDEAAAAWQEFETLIHPNWSGPIPFDTGSALSWFQAAFPIRSDAMVRILQSASQGAAEQSQPHCMQR